MWGTFSGEMVMKAEKENSSKCFIHGININLPSTQHRHYSHANDMEIVVSC